MPRRRRYGLKELDDHLAGSMQSGRLHGSDGMIQGTALRGEEIWWPLVLAYAF